jgi:sulfoxide reductase heme-binding subunit YedZ
VHLTSSPADWYAARAAGIAAYLILTAVVSLGIALAGKKQLRRWPRFAVEDVHRFGGLLVGALVVIHVLTIAVDSFLPFTLGQLIVPLTAKYRPLWTGLGIAAAELLLAIAIVNRLRDRLPYRTWRRVHYLNFAVWGAATLHGIFSGTDRSAPWLALLYGAAVGVVGASLAVRLGYARRAHPVFVAAAGGLVVLLLLWVGPLRKEPRAWNAANFSEPLTGAVIRSGSQFKEIVSMNGQGGNFQKVLVRADLLVDPQRLDATSLQLEYLPSGTLCRGQVLEVGSTSFAGVCRLPDGHVRNVQAAWELAPDGTLAGTLTSHA